MLGALAVLAGCARADAKTIDPSQDLHCFVVAQYYDWFAGATDAPQISKDAAKDVFAWYTEKMRSRVTPATTAQELNSKITPLLEAVKAKPGEFHDELTDCTKRAIADPAFAEWFRNRSA